MNNYFLNTLKKIAIFIFLVNASSSKAEDLPVELTHNLKNHTVDIKIGGKYFSSYLYQHSMLNKPVLFPVLTASGKTITRGYPFATRVGERVDHTHHYGIWFNHGDVNGIDFWNAGRTPPKPGVRYGKINHKEIKTMESGKKGTLTVLKEWVSDKGESMMLEETTYVFRGSENHRSITHITALKSTGKDITFRDSKEGVFGIRLARALENPSDEAVILTGADLKPIDKPRVDKKGVTGSYRNSEGIEGYPAVWGKRARWMQLRGSIENNPISISIFDAPSNVNHPPHWMARDYGLFAVNGMGSAVYTEGKETLNKKLLKGETLRFKNEIVISDGVDVDVKTVEQWYEDFVEKH